MKTKRERLSGSFLGPPDGDSLGVFRFFNENQKGTSFWAFLGPPDGESLGVFRFFNENQKGTSFGVFFRLPDGDSLGVFRFFNENQKGTSFWAFLGPPDGESLGVFGICISNTYQNNHSTLCCGYADKQLHYISSMKSFPTGPHSVSF